MRLHATVLPSIEAYVFNSTKAVLNLAWPTLVNGYNCPSGAKMYGQCPHATTDLALHFIAVLAYLRWPCRSHKAPLCKRNCEILMSAYGRGNAFG